MPNTQAPFGFRPIRRIDGAAWSSNITTRKMQNNAAALNRGDLVIALADGTVAIAAPAAGHVVLGVFVGCHYLSNALGYPIWTNYWPGAGAIGLVDAMIVDDPNVVFEAQANAGNLTMADIGINMDIVVNASTTGFSKMALNDGTKAVTATFPFRMVGLGNNGVYISDGYDATSNFNIVEVMPNGWMNQPGAGI
jgi:hypothetical protein